MFKGKNTKSQPVRESKQDNNFNSNNSNIKKISQSEKKKDSNSKVKLIKKPRKEIRKERSAAAWQDLDSMLGGWSD